MNSPEKEKKILAIPPYTMWHQYRLFWKREKWIAFVKHTIVVMIAIAAGLELSSVRGSSNQAIADQIGVQLSTAEEALGQNHLSDARVALAEAEVEFENRTNWMARFDEFCGFSDPIRDKKQRIEELRTRIDAEIDTAKFLELFAEADSQIIGDYWRLRPHEDPTGRKAILNPSERTADLAQGLQAAIEAASQLELPDLSRVRQLDDDQLSTEKAQQVRDRAGDLLFLWAIALEREKQGEPDQIHDAARHEAVRLLDAAEDLGYESKMLYEFRGHFRKALDDTTGSESDLRLSADMQPTTFYDHHFLAAELRDENNLEEETRQYQLALSKRPDDFWTLFRLATALERVGDGTQAAAMYQRLIAVEPENATLRNNLGNLLKELGRFEEAERELRTAIELKRDFFMAYTNLASLYAETKQLEKAQEVCEELLNRNIPDDVASDVHNNWGFAHERAGQDSFALAHFEQACEFDRNNTSAYRNYALALLKTQRFTDAQQAIDHALSVAPESGELYVVQGEILAKEGRRFLEDGDVGAAKKNYELAVAAFTEAIDREQSKSPLRDAYYNRGVILRRLGRLEEAFDDQSEVLLLSGGYYRDAVYELAMNYVFDRQWIRASGQLDQILARDPHDAKALLQRGRVLADRGGPKDLEQSERDFDQYIEIAPNDPAGYFGRGLTRFRREDWTGAIEDWQNFLQLVENASGQSSTLVSERSSILADMGTAFVRLRQFQEAIRVYNLSIELQPSLSVLGNRANAYLRSGNLAKAIADCSQVIESNADPLQPGVASSLARAYGLRAEAYLRQGRTSEAIQDLTESLQLEDMYEGRVIRAVANHLAGDRATALADLQNVIEDATQNYPNSPRLVFAHGMHDFLNDRMSQAITEFSHVPAEAPLDQFALAFRAGAWLKIGGQGLSAALRDADTLLKQWPDEEFAKSNARRIYEQLVESNDESIAAEARARLAQLR